MRPTDKPPTPIQRETLRFLREHYAREGYCPSERELAKRFGVGRTAMKDRLTALQRRGLVVTTARGVVPVGVQGAVGAPYGKTSESMRALGVKVAEMVGSSDAEDAYELAYEAWQFYVRSAFGLGMEGE